MWLGYEKNFGLRFHKSLVSELTGIDEMCDDPEVGRNEGEEEGYECEAEPVQSFTKGQSAYKTAKIFLMQHSIQHAEYFDHGSGTLFHIKCEVPTK